MKKAGGRPSKKTLPNVPSYGTRSTKARSIRFVMFKQNIEKQGNSGVGVSQNILLIGGCGYIGSYLYQCLKREGFDITVVDSLKRGNPLNLNIIKDDYADLDENFLRQFDSVLWFGGHSSVSESMTDPDGAVANNCLNLFSFAKRLASHTKLIYASSGSLYSTNLLPVLPASENSLASIPAQNAYDISKFAFDYLAKNFLANFYGLRMGTVSGYSPNLRPELVFNAMNIAAVTTGFVHLKNSESHRTILFLSDLWILVRKLLITKQKSGIYNGGSLSFKMGELAHRIASVWNAQVIFEGDSDSYSFLLDTTRMKAICGNDMVGSDLTERCRNFIAQFETESKSL
jgi:UDP-glucose 4-epimerase